MKSDDHWKYVNLAYFATQEGAKKLYEDVLAENSIFNKWCYNNIKKTSSEK